MLLSCLISEYVAGGQNVQFGSSTFFEYVPSGHVMQSSTSRRNPRLQEQLRASYEPGSEDRLELHWVMKPDPLQYELLGQRLQEELEGNPC